MDVARVAVNSIPGARAVLQDLSQQGFTPARRRLPGRVRRPRPRLGRARGAAQARSSEKMRQLGAGDRRRQRLPGRHARGAGRSRTATRRPTSASAWPTIGETVNAAIGGLRVGKFKDKGRRFDIRVRLLAQQRERPEDIDAAAGAHEQRRRSCAWATSCGSSSGRRCRPSRARTASAPSRSSPTSPPGASQAEAIARSIAIAREVLPDGYRAVPSAAAARPSRSRSTRCASPS